MIRPDSIFLIVRSLGLAAIAVLVAGCMLARSSDPQTVIAPQVAMPVAADSPEVEWALRVQRPGTDRMRDSDRIMVRVGDSQLQPYPGAVWLDDLPDMFQSLMIEAFEDSGRFAAIGRSGAIRSPFSLATDIRRFEAVDAGDGRLEVALSVQARLIHQASGRVQASRKFTRRQEVQGDGIEGLVAAFENAMSGLFADLAGWLLEQGEAREPSGD